MKRNLSLWLGLLAFALLPALAQTPAPKTKIHGHVTNPTGMPQMSGVVSLSTNGGMNSKFTFTVSPAGDYAGEAAPGSYTLVFRAIDTPPDKIVDSFEGVKIVAGQDVLQDIDMSRKEFVSKLTVDQQKQLEEIRKKNADESEVLKHYNADIKTAFQDIKDADNARQAAIQALGATASKADLDAKEAEIKTAKYTEAEALMLKDTVAKPDGSGLWAQLGDAQRCLKKYDEAEAAYKKVLELEGESKKPSPQNLGSANAGLGEIYARTGKIPEATAAFDAAAKVNPAMAWLYLKNEAVIYYQIGNAAAQLAAAEEAITADPKQAFSYYLKGQGLLVSATVDVKTGRYILPPGCAEAFQKYLDLAPTGQFAADAKGILAQSALKVESGYKAGKSK